MDCLIDYFTISKEVQDFITVFLIYITASLLCAFFYYLKGNSNNFAQKFFLSFISISLLPLFMASVGNNELSDITSFHSLPSTEHKNYFYLLIKVYAYAILVGLSGNTIIYKMLSTFLSKEEVDNLKKENEALKSTTEEQKKEIETTGKLVIEKDKNNLESTIESAHLRLLKELYGKKLYVSSAELSDTYEKSLIDLLKQEGMLMIGYTEHGDPSYRITTLGRLFVEKKDEIKPQD